MKELENKIVQFAEERDWLQFNTPENLAKSIAIESGELLECFQWNNNYDKDELKYEIADVMNYCILLCHQIGVALSLLLSDGSTKSFGEDFLRNELGVLLTRGVNGLYIYVCDEELRKVLKKNI